MKHVPRRQLVAVGEGTLLVLATVGLVLGGIHRPSLVTASFVAGSTARYVLALVTAAALLTAAFLVAQPTRRAAPALLTACALWSVPDWAGWPAAGSMANFVALASTVALPSIALWVLWAVVRPPRGRGHVLAIGLVFAHTMVVLTWNSFTEPGCWRACRTPTVSLAGDGHWLFRTVLAADIVVAAVLVIVFYGHRPRPDGHLLARFAGLALVVGLVAQALPPAGVVSTVAGPPRVWAFLLSQVAALCLVTSIAWHRLRAWIAIVRLNRLTVELQNLGTPAMLQDALRRAVRDPGLFISWWSPSHATWLGSDPAAPAARPGTDAHRVVTALTRAGEPLALVTHRATLPAGMLVTSLRPAMVLSLDNARLQAATTAELVAAIATGRRLVERTDAERRALQRNLHDGVQQRLVGLAMAVRHLRAVAADSDERAVNWDRADALVTEALLQVRRIAHRVHPPLLAEAGLRVALQELADLSIVVVVRVTDKTPSRAQFPRAAAVEAEAYAAVERALVDAARRGASRLEVRLSQAGATTWHVLIQDDGEPVSTGGGEPVPPDRVLALDGRLALDHGRGALSSRERR